MDPLNRFVPQMVETALGPVECARAGQGPTLLALHGAMGGWDQSALLGTLLAPTGYHVVAVSRPGYLGTPLSRLRSPEAQADLLAGLLDALGLTRAGVLAVSGGGPAAMHFAVRHPARCSALVLASTTGTRLTTPLPARVRVLRLVSRIPFAVRLLTRRAPTDDDAAFRRAIPDAALRARTLADPTSRTLLRALFASTSHRLSDRLPGTFADIDITRESTYPLGAIASPTLLLHGEADRVVPFAEHARALEREIAGAQLVSAPDGDHVFIFTHRALVQAASTAFLRRHLPSHDD